MILLNVGAGSSRDIPAGYAGWEMHTLDIDPAVNPDVCCDALKLADLAPGQYEAVYCSHNLEHFYAHDVQTVLAGFAHVLKDGGTAEIHVPNLRNLMEQLLSRNLDINDVWYRAGQNPVTFHDVLYGWGQAMRGGNLFYAHKCGFTPLSLGQALSAAGFSSTIEDQGSNIRALARKG